MEKLETKRPHALISYLFYHVTYHLVAYAFIAHTLSLIHLLCLCCALRRWLESLRTVGVARRRMGELHTVLGVEAAIARTAIFARRCWSAGAFAAVAAATPAAAAETTRMCKLSKMLRVTSSALQAVAAGDWCHTGGWCHTRCGRWR